MRRDTFQAIADPTRRKILHMIAEKPLNINTVAAHFSVSRTAVYKHLKILMECGLIEIRQCGRLRYCEAHPEKLIEVANWLERYHRLWPDKLDKLEGYLNEKSAKDKP
jgi:DNA-binding transcriptional ArsR family regulator